MFGHRIGVVWDDLAPKVCQLLDSGEVLWTSIDVVRFKVKDEPVGPVVLWIGVVPETVSWEKARDAANRCLTLLQESDITDVEIEFRSSVYRRSAGPSLHPYASDWDPTVNVGEPLTPALGLSIASQKTPHVEGTGGLYLAEGGGSEKILLLTARHVLFPPNGGPNFDYTYSKTTSSSRHEVLLFGTPALKEFFASIESRIDMLRIDVDVQTSRADALRKVVDEGDEGRVQTASEKLEAARKSVVKTNKAIEVLDRFYNDAGRVWRPSQNRILGHVDRSPPLQFGVGTGGFTEDYALVEIDSAKIPTGFKGNVLDLGAS